MAETRDALGNRVTVGERRLDGTTDPSRPGNDYRVLQPALVTDPNRNRTQVAVDTLGMVVGTAVMGKPEDNVGDSLDGFTADPTEATILDHMANPLSNPHAILGRATTRLLYDLFAYQRTRDQPDPQPVASYTMARETHDADLGAAEHSRALHSFTYSDGFGREIQTKVQAEPAAGPRWVGSGWSIFNNKGQPVRRFEPFFRATHRFEFGARVGVSSIVCYDPVGRIVATLHPDHTWEKVVFDPWRQSTWDANDTVGLDPRDDPDVRGFLQHADGGARLPTAEYLPTWHALRTDPAHAEAARQRWPDARDRDAQTRAAEQAASRAQTPATTHFDPLGRTFLTLAHAGFTPDGSPIQRPSRVRLDVAGQQREVRDADQQGDPLGRLVTRYEYDLLGNRIGQHSMDAVHDGP